MKVGTAARRRMTGWLLAGALLAIGGTVAQAQQGQSSTTPGTVFRDCPQCPGMVVVPAGGFVMGAAPGEEEREEVHNAFRGFSQPRVTLQIGAFALGRYEVTRGQFTAFVAETGHALGGGCWFYDAEGKWELTPSLNWRSPGFAQTDRHPVVCVDWNDAAAYAAWLGRKTGKTYRLPSEAEWEYAARAGSQTARPWGNAAGDACAHANVWDMSVKQTYPNATNMHPCSDGFVHTAPVGAFTANAFGLHDMIGNVWEWTQDCRNGTLAGMPDNGSARMAGDCSQRVGRGGSWNDNPRVARSAYRAWGGTGIWTSYRGFRLARTLD